MRSHRLLVPLWCLVFGWSAVAAGQDEKPQNVPPKGFKALFNGKDLSGWKGLVGNPKSRAAMSPEQLAEEQQKADDVMRAHWSVEDGVLVFDGKGKSLCTAQDYGDFELLVDWKIGPQGDSGIYLRGTPQVQIWDPNDGERNAVGSGGLFNNQKHPSKPLVVADNPVGEWNTFRIRMLGEKVWVWLNDKLVVDGVVLENYWERDKPIYGTGQIELQNHNHELYFRNVFIKEIVRADGAARIDAALPSEPRAKPQQPRRVLVYTHAAGFVHSSIPYGAHAVAMLGRKTGAFETDISNNPAMFLPENLNQYDAVVLVNTTGNWLLPRGDELKNLPAEEQDQLKKQEAACRQSLLDFIAGGKGLVGFHAASDSQYQWPEFGEMIGGYFNRHPWHTKVGVRVEQPDHALCAAFTKDESVMGNKFTITDEIYQFKAPYSRSNLRVLLSLDNDSVDVSKGAREDQDYAVAWINTHGKGRIFYSSLGHREEIYWNPLIMRFYLDGIQYALGDLTADATPSGAGGE